MNKKLIEAILNCLASQQLALEIIDRESVLLNVRREVKAARGFHDQARALLAEAEKQQAPPTPPSA